MKNTIYFYRLAVATLSILMIILCFWIQSYYTHLVCIQRIDHTIATLDQEYVILHQELNRRKSDHQSYEQKLSEWNDRAVSSPQPHETIYQILDIASTSTVTCIQVKQHQPIVQTNYTEIPATFHLHGSFDHVLLFFDHLETIRGLTTFAITDVSLQVARDPCMLDVMMKVYTTTLHVINVDNEFHHQTLKHSTL